jgi:hypothetical protein
MGHINFLVRSDDVNLESDNINSIKRHIEAISNASTGVGLLLKTEKTKFMFISPECRRKSYYKYSE